MSELIWYPERGYGKIEVEGFPYDDAYFDKYARYADTERGRVITRARVSLVRRYWPGPVCDVGIGSGAFIDAHDDACGYDVCAKAQDWLRGRDKMSQAYTPRAARTFWDSLEHIEDPDRFISATKKWVFVSLPIFDGPEHVLRSKHLRRDEHVWYFSESGLIRWIAAQGFALIEKNRMEEAHGREDIGTFAFHREPCQT